VSVVTRLRDGQRENRVRSLVAGERLVLYDGSEAHLRVPEVAAGGEIQSEWSCTFGWHCVCVCVCVNGVTRTAGRRTAG
jgi:hypothetical protein